MRRFLTSGIKAILAIAALSTAAHWAMRLQREPAAQVAALSAIPDPVTTGSIAPRTPEGLTQAPEPLPKDLDQQHLMKLIAGVSTERPKPQKALAKH